MKKKYNDIHNNYYEGLQSFVINGINGCVKMKNG